MRRVREAVRMLEGVRWRGCGRRGEGMCDEVVVMECVRVRWVGEA